MKTLCKCAVVLFLALAFAGAAIAGNQVGQSEAMTFNQPAPEWMESILAENRSCQRCGDGFCATQCGENIFTCPRDCFFDIKANSQALGNMDHSPASQASNLD